ncbi:MAG: glycosyltransferase [Acidobacteria bacterium]|nr:glycosyltransferase [Acidobacteriota bacterium]
MKLLWVKADFLHPTTAGGQIRTLETLKRLHVRHELHYVALTWPGCDEGPARAGEYSSRAFPVLHQAPSKTSLAFALQAAGATVSSMPLAISRWNPPSLRRKVSELRAREGYDAVFCDFLASAPSFEQLDDVILFQHNVETMIWRRHAEVARGLARRWYFRLQAERMERYERKVCQSVRRVIAVSESDSKTMQGLFGLESVPAVPTGVDTEVFAPQPAEPVADLIFLGSMDWMPNIDGVQHFYKEIWPLIVERRPETTLAIVGRRPSNAIVELSRLDSRIVVTGTVDDVRPYLWGSQVSIVPLRVGGGTRLKIYESMAAGLACVSTTIGAEGLEIHPPHDIRIADEPEDFARQCLELLDDAKTRQSVAQAGLEMVRESFSWESVTDRFEAAAGLR